MAKVANICIIVPCILKCKLVTINHISNFISYLATLCFSSQSDSELAMPATYFTNPKRLTWKLSAELDDSLETAKESIDQ